MTGAHRRIEQIRDLYGGTVMRFMETKAGRTRHLLLENKNAVIYGGGGEIVNLTCGSIVDQC